MLGPAELREIAEAMGEGRAPREADATAPVWRLPLAVRAPLRIADAMARQLDPLWRVRP